MPDCQKIEAGSGSAVEGAADQLKQIGLPRQNMDRMRKGSH